MTYDQAAWHEDAARNAGQPAERAFAHATLYRTWLRRRDLLAQEWPAAGATEALTANEMTEEGRAFTDAYYGRYLDDYAVVFGDLPAYAVEADEDAFDRIARVIDRRFAEWDYAGRPELPPDDEPAEELARLLDASEVPPGLTEAAVLGMSPEQVIEALQQMLRQRRSG
ncbi:MAG: hypothetical protein FJ038_06335 [Chloroflexi bacterium]|nr:hypothetical protein [Chloroflexota bacterium]